MNYHKHILVFAYYFKLSISLIDKPVNLDIVFASKPIFIAFLVKSMVAALKPFSRQRS